MLKTSFELQELLEDIGMTRGRAALFCFAYAAAGLLLALKASYPA
jgi:hypothetical protein